MFQVFKRDSVQQRNQGLMFDVRQLRQDECLIVKYDQYGKPVALQKVETEHAPGISSFGRAESDIFPGQKGRVYYKGSSWKAYCDGASAIRKGQKVLVTARRSLQLFVSPIEAPLEDLFL